MTRRDRRPRITSVCAIELADGFEVWMDGELRMQHVGLEDLLVWAQGEPTIDLLLVPISMKLEPTKLFLAGGPQPTAQTRRRYCT